MPEGAGSTVWVCVHTCLVSSASLFLQLLYYFSIHILPFSPFLSPSLPPSLPPTQPLRGQGRALYVSTFGGIAYNNNYPINACMYFDRYPKAVFR